MSGVCGANNICCGGDWVDCTGDCVNTQTDPTHCGDCDTVCAVDESCVAGICALVNATGIYPLFNSFFFEHTGSTIVGGSLLRQEETYHHHQ